LNNLFGKGKGPFWQQAYTNPVKFIILLHKITYDYVTLSDVYQCAISPVKLEKIIHEAEQKIGGRRYVLLSSEAYLTHVTEYYARLTVEKARAEVATRPASYSTGPLTNRENDHEPSL
jgi:hypothetical protein